LPCSKFVLQLIDTLLQISLMYMKRDEVAAAGLETGMSILQY